MLCKHSEERLDRVLADAAGTHSAGVITNTRRDFDAVQAALDTPWTTSPAEGRISKLKTLKRAMYGRAGFRFLQARVLHAA